MSLQPSATVTLRDLGILDRLVACTKYCADVCPEVADGSRVIVSDSWTAQSQQILAVQPDLVLASVPYQLEAVGEILKAGIRFLGLAPRTLADIYADIAAIAGILGEWERGQSVIAKMQSSIEEVREIVANLHARVFCEEWGKPIIASQPWVAELVKAAGGEFVGEPGKTTTAEEVAPPGRTSFWQPGAGLATACRWKRSSSSEAGRICRRPRSASVLYQRRTAEHTGQQPDRRTVRHGLGASSRAVRRPRESARFVLW